MSDRMARILFAYVDGLLATVSGAMFLLFPAFGLSSLAPGFDGTDVARSPVIMLLVRSFGQLVLTFGLVAFFVVRRGDRRIVRVLVAALLVGDIVHLAVHVPFVLAAGAWTGGTVFGIAYEVFIAASRTLYLARDPRPRDAG